MSDKYYNLAGKKIKIESTIPYPDNNAGGRHGAKWPPLFHTMKVGDSVLIEEKDRINFLSSAYANGFNGEIVTRKVEQGQCRVWKVAKNKK